MENIRGTETTTTVNTQARSNANTVPSTESFATWSRSSYSSPHQYQIVNSRERADSTSLTLPSLASTSISSSPSSPDPFLSDPNFSSLMNLSVTSFQPLSPLPSLSIRSRSRSRDNDSLALSPPISPTMKRGRTKKIQLRPKGPKNSITHKATLTDLSLKAREENDAMVYLDGPRIYTCGQCRTHLTSHDEIISKSFHGRNGRAYLFENCVNVLIGPAEDRRLITGLHSVNDIMCKRCKTLIGWTYTKAYERSQKYKEGKFIVEKIHLHMEESDSYEIHHPAGERRDRWRRRSISWGEDKYPDCTYRPRRDSSPVYEYRQRTASWTLTPSEQNDSSPSTVKLRTFASPLLPSL